MSEEIKTPEVQETAAPVTEGPVEPSAQVKDALSAYAGAPSVEQREMWKAKFGEINCSGFSETELFIWRPLSRLEHKQLQLTVSQSQEPVDLEELTVKTCLLWVTPLASKSLETKAGTMSTIFEQVMQGSNFVAPQLASQLVVRL